MKREKPKVRIVKSAYPLLLWKECECCGNEVVREMVWKYSHADDFRAYCTRYICYGCAPTETEAEAKVALLRARPPRPPPPMPHCKPPKDASVLDGIDFRKHDEMHSNHIKNGYDLGDPICDKKPEGPPNEILHTSAWGAHRYSPPPPPPKRVFIDEALQ